MSAHCTSCIWTGTVQDVVKFGGCPDCGARVSYDFRPLTGNAIAELSDFNRRAVSALRQISTDNWTEGFLNSIKFDVQRGLPLKPSHQQQLYLLVNRHALRLGDRAVCDYAAHHARGAD